MASWDAIWLCWHYLWVINMASRLASGGINLAGSSSSYNVSAAAGPTWIITARWNREAGTKQNKPQQGRGCWLCGVAVSYNRDCLFFDFLLCFLHMNNVRSCWCLDLIPHSVKLLIDCITVLISLCLRLSKYFTVSPSPTLFTNTENLHSCWFW